MLCTTVIPDKLIKHVSFNRDDKLCQSDSERYLFTAGISSCTGLSLYFPKARVISLAHIMPTTDFTRFVSRMHDKLEEAVSEAPEYVLAVGPFMLDFLAEGKEKYLCERHDIVREIFNAKPKMSNIFRGKEIEDNPLAYFNMMVEKETGVTAIYTESARKRPEFSDFYL